MVRDYDKDIDNIQYGKSFAKDPKFSEILSDTSIDSKVTMTNVHKNINSMAGQLEKSQLDFHKQIKGISGSISSTVKQQERLVKQIQMRELASTRDVKVVEKSVQQIMGKLGYTVDILGKSSKKILIDTAKTTKETLKQYGQALSADFNINKSNFLAMSLAKASPIFGYFVGKFMETGIFKHFSELIKEKLGMAVTFVGNKIKDLWGRGTTKVKTWYNKRKESKQNQKELPKLQTGGYVTKAGAAKLHAAEVVAPVEKLRDMFTEALQPVTDTVKKIYSFMKWAAVFRTAGKLYRMFKRSKYSSYLSKSKDPQIKLTEDMGLFFSQSMMKYDEIISTLKGKGKEEKEGLTNLFNKITGKDKGFQFGTLGDFDINAGKSKTERAKILAKTFTDEFGKAFKAELKKPENMFNKVKEKIGDERINKTKDWIEDLKNIITGKEVLTVSKTERLKEKLGYNRAKEKGKEYYQFGKDKYNEEGIPLYKSYKTKLKEGYNKFQKSEGVTKTKKFIHDKITGVSAEGIHDAFIAVFRGVNKVLMAPLKILNKTMSILVRSTIMLGRGISKLTFGIWRIVKWTAGLPFRLLFSTVKTLTKVVTSIPNAFMSATTSIFNKMTNFMKKGGFSGAAKRFGGTMKTLFIGADKQPESEVLAGDTGAATITEINKKEKKKKGLEGELQKIRHSITEFHGSVSKDWAKDTEISKKQSETVKKSWKGMIEQFKTSRDGMKNQLNTLKESYKTFKEQKNLQKKIKNATEGTESKLGLGQSALKKAFSSIGTWLMIGVTLLKSAFGNIIGMVKGLLSKIPFLKKLFPNLGGPGGVGGSKGGLFSKAKKSGKFKYGGTGVKAGGIAGLGMGAGMSTLGGGIAGVMSGIEVGKERGMASGIAQGAISGSLSTIGGLLLGPIGTVLGKMLGDAIGKAAFGLGDWMAKHFNIFEIVDKYILSPIQNIFRTIGNVITDIKNGIVSAITSVLPDWAKKLIGITDTKPQSEGDKIREQMKRDPEAAFKEAQFQAAKRSKINREAGGDAGMKWARGYESGGVVPKAPNGGVDGRGGQLALVHEGEKIIPKSVVESSRLNGGPTKDLKMGSSKPGNIVDNILSGLKEMVTPGSLDLIKGMGNNISNFGSNIFGKLKIGFENLKENLGPKSGFGWLSRMFESAGAGPAAIGWDSTGGKSYGYYQLAEKRGTPKKFLEQFPKIGQQFTGLQIGSEQFDAKWRELAKSDPSFAQAQHDFIKQQYLNPYLAKIKAATGIDLSTKHSAVLEEILSTAVQYGPNSGVIPKALSGLTQTAKDEEIIKKIGEYKFANVGEHFRSSTSAVQQAVANRISRETSAALQALGISNAEMTAPYGSQPGKTSMFGRLTNFASGIAEKVYSSFKGALGMPANSGLVTSEFGPRNTGLSGASTIHKGIDLRARQGEPVYSIQDGIVTDINNKWGQVSIKHPNGFESSYAHLSEYGVQPGTKIGKGQKIGAAGKTGPIPGMAAHLHMSVKDPTGNYVNPRKLFENAGINLASKDGAKTKEMGSPGPELSKKDVARMQADKDTSMANLLNESSKGFQDAALNSMNQNGKQTAMIVNSMSNNISSSMNSLAKSVAAGGSGGGNNQGNNDISAILSGDMA